ncbi:hypothetical protein V0U79_11050 [Hyphobacterium sp. HN65]|uniref:Sugar transporter n=1 Tax=Hyphobacterium lacteum TaxID=3116575 RepID=A0ABU7LSM6_9PROT|nr:hypothetical protein [Hyphobacterium sp. HN65]MEE2526909.1 hypothetical protein [Hyphobacterium sp. HN65]
MFETQAKTPVWFWIVGVIGLLWFSMGAFDYVATQYRLDFYMSEFTPEQLEFFYGFPAWYKAIWAISVWTAVIGSVLLLIRNKLASLMFFISLISFIVSAIYSYGFTNAMEMMGGIGSIIFSIVIFLSVLAFFWLARWAAGKGILR